MMLAARPPELGDGHPSTRPGAIQRPCMPDMRAENDRIASLRGQDQLLRMFAMRLRPLSTRQLAQAMRAGNEAGSAICTVHVVEDPKHVGHDLPSSLDRLRMVGMQPLAAMSLRRIAAPHADQHDIAAQQGRQRAHHARVSETTSECRCFLQP